MNVTTNKIAGVCPCGSRLYPGDGFWDSKIKRLYCTSCLKGEEARQAKLSTQPVKPTAIEARGLVRLFFHPKKAYALARTFDVSQTNRESFSAVCDTIGCSYTSDLGWHCSLSLVPDLVETLKNTRLKVEVTDGLADALLSIAEATRNTAADATIRSVGDRQRGKKLMPYQQVGVEFLAPRTAALLADDGGLGKTAQALKAAGKRPRILVICPSAVKGAWVGEELIGGWTDEVRLWRRDIKSISIAEGYGSFKWPEENSIEIINYKIIPPTPDQVLKRNRIANQSGKKSSRTDQPAPPPPHGVTLIIDECHELGNKASLQTKNVRWLARAVASAGGHVYGLSATPMKNNADELWSVLESLGLAHLAFGSYDKFRTMWGGEWRPCGRGRKRWSWAENPGPEVAERLRRVMLRRRKRDVLHELPPLTMRRVVVEVDKETLKLCDAAVKELAKRGISIDQALETVDEARGGFDIQTISKALEALSRVKTPFALERAQAYERTETPCLIFGANVVVVDAFVGRPGWGTIKGEGATVCGLGDDKATTVARAEAIRAFQDGEVNHMALMIQACGVGVNLTRASEIVLASKVWSPLMVLQAIWRAERIGQKNPMNVTDIVANHPLDLRMSQVLEIKLNMFAGSVDAASVAAEDVEKRVDPGIRYVEAAQHRVSRMIPGAGQK